MGKCVSLKPSLFHEWWLFTCIFNIDCPQIDGRNTFPAFIRQEIISLLRRAAVQNTIYTDCRRSKKRWHDCQQFIRKWHNWNGQTRKVRTTKCWDVTVRAYWHCAIFIVAIAWHSKRPNQFQSIRCTLQFSFEDIVRWTDKGSISYGRSRNTSIKLRTLYKTWNK